MTKQEEVVKFILDEVITPLREENENLHHRIRSLNAEALESREAVKLYKSLLNEGTIYVNTHYQDCDGVNAQYSYKFTDIDDYFQAKKHYDEEECEGSHSWNVVSKRNALTEEEEGIYGQGWGIN